MRNYEIVKNWMKEVKQDCPDIGVIPNLGVLQLRTSLIVEETNETVEAINILRSVVNTLDYLGVNRSTFMDHMIGLTGNVLKELADILVVVYGTFVALGFDADEIFSIVMAENFGKVQNAQFREDGKVIVLSDVKERLKRKTKEDICQKIINSNFNPDYGNPKPVKVN